MIDVIKRTSESNSSSKEYYSVDVMNYNGPDIVEPENVAPVVETKPKRGRPARKEPMYEVKNKDSEVSDYEESYYETNALLKGTIGQIDMLNNDIAQELKVIKQSKTLKKKYDYISELTSTSSNLLGQKISAVRELNNSINSIHNLELKRMKELKLNEDDGDDDRKMMDMYNAFINTPIGINQPQMFAPSAIDVTMQNNSSINMITAQDDDPGYNNYINNLTPQQKKMYNDKTNIKVCVIYDPDTGFREFKNINMDTMQEVPGLELPSPTFLEDTQINLKTGIARNANLNLNYPLIVQPSAGGTGNII